MKCKTSGSKRVYFITERIGRMKEEIALWGGRENNEIFSAVLCHCPRERVTSYIHIYNMQPG